MTFSEFVTRIDASGLDTLIVFPAHQWRAAAADAGLSAENATPLMEKLSAELPAPFLTWDDLDPSGDLYLRRSGRWPT
jgi:hypothetical protein